VEVRRRVMLAATACGVSLAAGIPLLGLTALPRTETADGYIIWVHPSAHALLLDDVGADDPLRGREVLIHLPERGAPRVQPGGQPATALRPGQRVRARISRRSHWAHEITLDD
jgi:hypothetical protein